MLAQDAQRPNKDIPYHLTQLINTEIQQLEQLRETLETEKSALGSHDAELMENTTKQKRAAVAGVEKSSQQRINYVRSLGINPLLEGWFEKLQTFTQCGKELSESFDYLLSLTSRCRSLNQTNGLMISRREQLTSKVINILRANSTPEIYSGSGQSESRTDTRTLGKA